jgi:hypothetical protein
MEAEQEAFEHRDVAALELGAFACRCVLCPDRVRDLQ